MITEYARGHEADIRKPRGVRDPFLTEWIRIAFANHMGHDRVAEEYVDTFHPGLTGEERERVKAAFEDGIALGRY